VGPDDVSNVEDDVGLDDGCTVRFNEGFDD